MDIYCSQDYENKMMARLNMEMLPLVSQSVNLQIEFSKTGLNEEDKLRMTKEKAILEDKITNIRNTFINENASSIAALWLMEDMLVRKQIDPINIEETLDKVSTKYHAHYFYKT